MSLRVIEGMVVGISDPKITEVIIPPRVVHTIGPNAFANCKELRSVIFQENSGVRSIESGAFSGCDSLCMVHLPDSVQMIWDNAFRGCVNLSSIRFSSNLLFIGNSVFNACKSLENVDLPSSLVFIDKRAFYNCPQLKRIRMPRKTRVITAQSESDLTTSARMSNF